MTKEKDKDKDKEEKEMGWKERKWHLPMHYGGRLCNGSDRTTRPPQRTNRHECGAMVSEKLVRGQRVRMEG